ncbi:MAG: disulfide bond formation protein B [Acetobacteraceae bacterium]|nr:disulfide bond formation protein B [Acetobacteraceae bacterium]
MLPYVSRREANPVVTASLAVMLIALATIAGAWFFQLVIGLVPCPMCLEQRYAYYTLIPLSALVAASAGRGSPRGVLLLGLALLAIIALANAAFGVYHAGVEWKFWQGPTSCTGATPSITSAVFFIETPTTEKVVACDEVQFRFLGLSLAGYNALISLVMAAIAAWGFVRTAKH